MALASKLVGIFGGTFDPIHLGHLRLAEELADQLDLSQVRFIPARVPPHRATPRVTSTHRLAMVHLACEGNPRFWVDDRECNRQGASYTVDTLLELRAEFGAACPFYLLMGMDAYLGLPTWSRWQQLYELSHIVIAQRPGFDLDPAAMSTPLAAETSARRVLDSGPLRAAPGGCVLAVDSAMLEISATAIRAALRDGRSVRYLLPDSVLDYIASNHLYKEFDAG